MLIYGENGSGKTTLLKILAGYMKPTKGLIVRRARVIYIPQNILLFFHEPTIHDEIVEICKNTTQGSKCIEEGYKLIRDLDISADQSPFNLSHGQMVKLAVSLAHIARADLILMDEPFSGITYIDRAKLVEYIGKSSVPVVVTTSDLDAVYTGIWSTMLHLEDGVLKPLVNPRTYYTLQYAAYVYEVIKNSVRH